MANSVSHAALPFPVKGARFTIQVPYLDADGDPTDPTTPDTERSIDGAAFADCTEEVSTISGSNGVGYITLTGDEMNASMVAVAAKVASGPKATLATLFPRVLPALPAHPSGTAQAGAAGTITLQSTAPAFDISGCIVKTTGGTGGAGGSGSQGNQARVITAYNTSTKVATVVPDWETNPSSDTTYAILLTDMAANAVLANVLAWNGTAVATPATAGVPSVDPITWKGGTIPTPNVTGVPIIDLKYILGTALTETSGQIAAAFTKFFNKASPTGTVNSLPDAVAGAAGGVSIVGSAMALTSGAVQAVWDALTSALTTSGSIGKLLVDKIDATISSRSTYAGNDTSGTTTLLTRITGLLQTKAEADTAHGLLATAANLTTAQADLDDIQTRLPAALAADGSIKASLQSILGTALTEGAAGRIVANFKTFFNVASATGTQDVIPTVTTLTNAPSDSSGVTTLLGRLTALRAGYLDNLSAGAVALASALSSAAGDITTLLGRLTSGRASNLDNLDAAVSSRATLAAADVWAVGTRTLTSYGTLIADTWSGLTSAAANKIADHTWRRNSANIAASADGDTYDFRSPLGMVRKLTNKLAVLVGVLTAYEEDDTTVAGQQAVATDPDAEHVTGLDTV